MTASIDPQALAASLRRLESNDEPAFLEQSLRRVIEACVQLFDLDGSGLMLADEHSDLRYVVAAGPTGRLLEDAQIETGEGPCVDTYVLDTLVDSADTTEDPRWPELAERVSGQGIRAVLGVPIHLSGVPVGSLDVYHAAAYGWDDADRDALRRYGHVVEAMLAAALSAEQAGELASQLNYALEYRMPIERAIGYLMARDQVGHTEAFNLLRSAARNHRRKIGDVAEVLLRTGKLPGETP